MADGSTHTADLSRRAGRELLAIVVALWPGEDCCGPWRPDYVDSLPVRDRPCASCERSGEGARTGWRLCDACVAEIGPPGPHRPVLYEPRPEREDRPALRRPFRWSSVAFESVTDRGPRRPWFREPTYSYHGREVLPERHPRSAVSIDDSPSLPPEEIAFRVASRFLAIGRRAPESRSNGWTSTAVVTLENHLRTKVIGRHREEAIAEGVAAAVSERPGPAATATALRTARTYQRKERRRDSRTDGEAWTRVEQQQAHAFIEPNDQRTTPEELATIERIADMPDPKRIRDRLPAGHRAYTLDNGETLLYPEAIAFDPIEALTADETAALEVVERTVIGMGQLAAMCQREGAPIQLPRSQRDALPAMFEACRGYSIEEREDVEAGRAVRRILEWAHRRPDRGLRATMESASMWRDPLKLPEWATELALAEMLLSTSLGGGGGPMGKRSIASVVAEAVNSRRNSPIPDLVAKLTRP